MRDPSRWPPAPPREMQPITEADFARMILSQADLARLLVPFDLGAVARDHAKDKAG